MSNAEKEVLIGLLECIVQNTSLSKKDLGRLNADLREKLLEMDERIRVAKEQNQSEAERISKESAQLAADRRKVLKQLAILNKMADGPILN